jgi:hypothetical protein
VSAGGAGVNAGGAGASGSGAGHGGAGASGMAGGAPAGGAAGASETGPSANGYCGDGTPGLIAAAGDPTDPVMPFTEEPVSDSTCNAVVRTYPLADSSHVADCSPVEYGTNPPSSGHHYPDFPLYRVYDDAIPRGFWVHPMEHGGVVFTYSCTDCADEVQAAKSLVATLGIDPHCANAGPPCSATPTNQILMTPDPGIPTRWAASAWGVTLTADCFETAVFQNFAMSFRNFQSPELICGNDCSTDVTRPPPQ